MSEGLPGGVPRTTSKGIFFCTTYILSPFSSVSNCGDCCRSSAYLEPAIAGVRNAELVDTVSLLASDAMLINRVRPAQKLERIGEVVYPYASCRKQTRASSQRAKKQRLRLRAFTSGALGCVTESACLTCYCDVTRTQEYIRFASRSHSPSPRGVRSQ